MGSSRKCVEKEQASSDWVRPSLLLQGSKGSALQQVFGQLAQLVQEGEVIKLANKRNLSRVLLCCVLASSSIAAQVPPREGVVSQRGEIKPRTHRFFDRNNLIGFSAMFGVSALDHRSTCRDLRAGGRERWLPTQSCATIGFVLYSGSSGAVGLSYWLHRRGHHRLERWLPRIRTFTQGLVASWNW